MVELAYQMKRIDHIEVYVPDRYEAAKWYEADVLQGRAVKQA